MNDTHPVAKKEFSQKMLIMEAYIVKNETNLPVKLLEDFHKYLRNVNRGLITEEEYTDLLEQLLISWMEEISGVISYANKMK